MADGASSKGELPEAVELITNETQHRLAETGINFRDMCILQRGHRRSLTGLSGQKQGPRERIGTKAMDLSLQFNKIRSGFLNRDA
jgi:hypothetical protein